MKAIPTAEICTTCHGVSLKPEVSARLQQLYPADQATGFAVGDLRGAFTLSERLNPLFYGFQNRILANSDSYFIAFFCAQFEKFFHTKTGANLQIYSYQGLCQCRLHRLSCLECGSVYPGSRKASN
mgnify:CR=1 FL=1